MSDVIQTGAPPRPGQDWLEIVGRPTLDAFSRAFASEVVLEASVTSRALVGPAELWRFFQATRTMYERIGFTHETAAGAKTCLEWEGMFGGKPIAGATILTRDDQGAIASVRLYHRPLEQVIAFAEALVRHFV
jgi:hypothetical protein